MLTRYLKLIIKYSYILFSYREHIKKKILPYAFGCYIFLYFICCFQSLISSCTYESRQGSAVIKYRTPNGF